MCIDVGISLKRFVWCYFRHQLSDPSKPEFSSEDGNKVGRNEEVVDIAHNSGELQQNFDPGSTSAEPPYESGLSNELARTLSYDCVSPDCDRTTSCAIESRCITEFNGSTSELVPYAEKGSYESEENIAGMTQVDGNKDAAGCEWENIFSDAPDLLFNSPNDPKCLTDLRVKSLEQGTSFCTSLTDDVQNSGATDALGLSQQHEMDTTSQHENSADTKQRSEDQELLVSLGDMTTKFDDEVMT